MISCSENFSDIEESTAEKSHLERLNQEQILEQTEGRDKEQVLKCQTNYQVSKRQVYQ